MLGPQPEPPDITDYPWDQGDGGSYVPGVDAGTDGSSAIGEDSDGGPAAEPDPCDEGFAGGEWECSCSDDGECACTRDDCGCDRDGHEVPGVLDGIDEDEIPNHRVLPFDAGTGEDPDKYDGNSADEYDPDGDGEPDLVVD